MLDLQPIDEDTEEIAISAPPPPPNALGPILLEARRDLWKAQPRGLAVLLNPLREYIVDPSLAISNLVFLPALMPPILDALLAKLFSYTFLVVIHLLYCQIPKNARKTDPQTNANLIRDTLRNEAKNSLLHGTSTGKLKVLLKPLSDWDAALRYAVAHAVSAMGALLGLLVHPQKMRAWVDAMSHFNGFLGDSGVGAELQETLMKPLLRGRLMDDFKMLNDIQEQYYADRVVKTVCCERETIDKELKDGKRWMRFATAAYGTEMSRSKESQTTAQQAIAVHTGVAVEDIQILHAESNQHRPVLHHFVAVDHATQSIVLALRGTLSRLPDAGSVVDMQGTAANYVGGKAHQGLAEMAENVWDMSGDQILKICDNPQFQEYRFLITGHSLGAGTACLLNLKLHVEQQLGDRPICCYAFAPPPTFSTCCVDGAYRNQIELAIQNTVSYIQERDIVPFLSISALRRLATLLDAVDHQTETISYGRRWKIFHDYEDIPQEVIDSVLRAEIQSHRAVEGACNLIIPARVVVWCQKNFAGTLQAYGCDPTKLAAGNVCLNPDMLSDHLPARYEDVLDALVIA